MSEEDDVVFAEETMACMETIRQSDLCNMWDGGCVEELVEDMCPESYGEILEAMDEPGGYGKVMSAFIAWKGRAA